jgi:hypothetical protein
MNTEKWNEICFHLFENIKSDISERDYENNVIKALTVLGWKEFSGNVELRPSIKIGANNSIIPDFVIRSNEKERLFVIEIKQPNLPLNPNFQQQLFSYMRQLKLEYGILIGQRIQIFYDGFSGQENPILLENIEFKRENKKAIEFVNVFSKMTFNKTSLENYKSKSLERIKRKNNSKKLKEKILTSSFQEKIRELIKQEFLKEYDDNIIENILSEIDINITSKNNFERNEQTKLIKEQNSHTSNNTEPQVIASIKRIITTEPKTQNEILEELTTLIPGRNEKGMRKTIIAQLGGKNRPVRIEKERHFNLIIDLDKDGEKRYSINKSNDYSRILPIELNPKNESDFKNELLSKKRAYITTFYENGDKEEKIWNANRFKESSNVIGNLRSKKEFRSGNWQDRGIEKVFVSINKN